MKKNIFISLQKGFLTLMSAALLFSCSSIEPFDVTELVESQEAIELQFKASKFNPNARYEIMPTVCGSSITADIFTDKHRNLKIGTVTAYNDDKDVYIYAEIDDDKLDNWFFSSLKMYVGTVAVDFEAKGKKNEIVNPAPGKFPYKEEFGNENGTGVQDFEWVLEGVVENLVGFREFDIAIHVGLINVSEFDGLSAKSYKKMETWVGAQEFSPKGNWATYFSFTARECIVENTCDASWGRSDIPMSGQRSEDLELDPDLEVTYQVNSDNGTRAGDMKITRTGNGNTNGNNKGYVFKAVFTPDSGYSLEEMTLTVKMTAESTGSDVKSVRVENSNTVELPFAPALVTTNTASSLVSISVISNACSK